MKKEHATIEYDDDNERFPVDSTDVPHHQQNDIVFRDANATMRLSMLETQNPMFMASFPVPESMNRLFRTPEESRQAAGPVARERENRLLA